MTKAPLSNREQLRYARQMILGQVGIRGQQSLKHANVLVVGAGGLGSPAALYLAAAGIGSLTLVDGDQIELSNLHRQVLFADQEVDSAKVDCAGARLRALNGDISIAAIDRYLDADNARDLISRCDLVLDCSDNYATRYLINDCCVSLAKPWLFAAVDRFQGCLSMFLPGAACFRCLYPQPPEAGASCSARGVMGVVPGALGLLQATEAIKYLLGLPLSAARHLVLFDALTLSLRHIALSHNPGCWCQGGERGPHHSEDHGEQHAAVLDWAHWEALLEERSGQLVDIRSAEAYQAGNAGGINVPCEQVSIDHFASCLSSMARDTAIGLYCQSGHRSERLAARLQMRGLNNVFSIVGGLESYRVHCLSTQHSPEHQPG